MLTYEQFRADARYCPPLRLSDEDQPQDERDWKKKVREYQEERYRVYTASFEPEERNAETLHNTKEKPLHNTLRNTKWNEYMKNYRKRPVECPKCGWKFNELRRVK